MDRSISVRTPESIAFSYELAGLGSRFLAVAVDMALQLGVLLLIVWGLYLAGSHLPLGPVKASVPEKTAQALGFAILAVVIFLVFFGYFIAFETFRSGQTPGKKLLGIRVVRDGGYPIDIGGAFIRNLIRIGELGLGFYALSALSCLLSSENKRLGDIAAGTIVVRDARAQSLTAILRDAQEPPSRMPLLSEQEHALISRFIARRGQMAAQPRRTLASQIAQSVRKRVSRDLQLLDDEELLEKLNAAW